MLVSLLVTATAITQAEPTPTASIPKAPFIILHPEYIRRPSAQDVSGVYPESALRAGRGGGAIVSCIAKADGSLEKCRLLEEHPANDGFGKNALWLATRYQIAPKLADGRSVEGGLVTLSLAFSIPK